MSTSALPTITLHYFNIRGKAEPTRLMLEDAGVAYEDVRIEREDWFATKKAEYKERGISKFGQIPVLQVGERFYPQRYVPRSPAMLACGCSPRFVCLCARVCRMGIVPPICATWRRSSVRPLSAAGTVG